MNINLIDFLSRSALYTIYVFVSCYGLYLIKSAEGWKSLIFFGGFCLYGFGAVLWMIILRVTPLSFAFPVAAGALTVGTLLTGAIVLHESVSQSHIAGAVFIVVGIVLIASNK